MKMKNCKLNSLSRYGIFTVLFGTLIYFLINAYNFDSGNTTNPELPKYKQVRIFAKTDSDFKRMADADLFIDHANSKPGQYLDAWLSENEISLLNNSGVPYQVLVEDWMEYYNSQPRMTEAELDAQVRHVYESDAISHSIYGSMGGYMNLAEVTAKLDSMRMWYPQFISAKFSIGYSYQGRPMWAVRVTHFPDNPTGRPQVLIHALIHAREPMSMTHQFYYMFWLMENYNTNFTARYILDNREIYWIPVYNPDGYRFNDSTYPTGGGNWRKNRKPCTGGIGTDLNRNFGTYQFWNSTNGGSSTSCNSDTYRGTAPFSEPETFNIMNFVNTHNFNSAVSAHTYGNLLIKPWCWQDPIGTPEDNKYNALFATMDYSNPAYLPGFPSQTVGYKVRGGTDDWYYNDSVHTGHSILSYTPETGISFWPTQGYMLPLSEGMLFNNQYWTLIAGPYVEYKSSNFNQTTYTPGSSGTFRVRFQNIGKLAANNTRILFTPGNSYVTIPTQQYNYNMAIWATDSATFNFTVSSGAQNNCYVPAFLTIKQDTTTVYRVGIYIPVGTPTVSATLLNDNASSFSNWTAWGTSASWNITTSQYHSAPSSFTESPSGSYGSGADVSMILNAPINVSNNPAVFLSFWHRYQTEATYDYCMVEVSENNGNTWQPVAEYHGTNTTWTQQTFDISRYANRSAQMKIRFRLVSDGGVTADGWYVDDVVLTSYCTSPLVGVTSNPVVPLTYALAQNYPNPFNPKTVITYQIPEQTFVTLKVYNLIGQEVATLVNEKKEAGSYDIEFDGSNLASGMYFYKITSGDFTDVKKMILVK
jgi:hypothetical protein